MFILLSITINCVVLRPLDQAIQHDAIKFNGYNIITRDRSSDNGNGGGIVIYVKNNFIPKNVNKHKDILYETITFNVHCNNIKLSFIVSYRPPRENIDGYLKHIEELLLESDSSSKIFLIGDLNLDFLSPISSDLKTLLNSLALNNFITVPTRVTFTSETLIDILCSNNDTIFASTGVINVPFSDHCMIYQAWHTKIKYALIAQKISEKKSFLL